MKQKDNSELERKILETIQKLQAGKFPEFQELNNILNYEEKSIEEIIGENIKEKFGTKAEFSKKMKFLPTQFMFKIKALRNKYDWINDFISPLGLRVKIVKKENNN